MIFDSNNNRHTQLLWDANGNLSTLWMCEDKFARFHDWDDENRLRMVMGNGQAGYYGYDANGERVYKLIGGSEITHTDDESSDALARFDNAVLYPNPYVTITKKGYTKHYYANGERLATSIGRGGFCKITHETIYHPETDHEISLLQEWIKIYNDKEYPFEYHHESLPTLTYNVDIAGQDLNELQYWCPIRRLKHLRVEYEQDILRETMSHFCEAQGEEDEIFYTHGDHLGSASWITDCGGHPIQYLHYLPYGQLLANQTPYGYDERYKFTGKERDAETGYDFFGARYYMPLLYHWTKVDPLVDDYLHISPYAYCSWNPIKYVDPDGRGPNDRVILARELAEQQIPYNPDNGYYLRTATSPEALATMDCSEFVCRVMAGDGITSTIESHSTRDMLANMMSDETKFIKSDIPQAGDIVLWAGHTGIIEGYNEKDNTVTVLHATRYEKNDGTIVSSTRRENYSLNYYRGKKAFFYRPVNETPDVFEDSSTAKLQEIIVKPSKDDQNANY